MSSTSNYLKTDSMAKSEIYNRVWKFYNNNKTNPLTSRQIKKKGNTPSYDDDVAKLNYDSSLSSYNRKLKKILKELDSSLIKFLDTRQYPKIPIIVALFFELILTFDINQKISAHSKSFNPKEESNAIILVVPSIFMLKYSYYNHGRWKINGFKKRRRLNRIRSSKETTSNSTQILASQKIQSTPSKLIYDFLLQPLPKTDEILNNLVLNELCDHLRKFYKHHPNYKSISKEITVFRSAYQKFLEDQLRSKKNVKKLLLKYRNTRDLKLKVHHFRIVHSMITQTIFSIYQIKSCKTNPELDLKHLFPFNGHEGSLKSYINYKEDDYNSICNSTCYVPENAPFTLESMNSKHKEDAVFSCISGIIQKYSK